MITPSRSQTYGATVVFFLLVIVSTACAKYSGGTGEPNDPYQITTAADLIALGETPNDYNKHFILTADIDLDPNLPGRKVFDKAVIAPDPNQTNGYFDGIPFGGVFDGDGHKVSHLTVKGASYLGLFGQLEHSWVLAGEVKNLGVVDVNIVASGDCVGGLVGSNLGNVTCTHSTGVVTSTGSSVGGLVGGHFGSITASFSSSVVSGSSAVGGLVGGNGARIYASYSSGAVRGNEGVGGLVGSNFNAFICVDLCGWSLPHLTRCYSTCVISGARAVGGLVGDNNAYDGTVTQCYSTGFVIGTDGYIGGLIGRGDAGYGYVTRCFWDAQTSGQATSDGGIGKTTAEMQTAQTFLDAGWDFVGETANGTEDTWKIAEGLGYPRLAWEKYSGGTGEPNDPYQIATAADLIALGETPDDYDKHFLLTGDIDLDPNLPGGRVFDRAVIAPDTGSSVFWYHGPAFSGVFNGDGHMISHLTIQGQRYLGLFGLFWGVAQDLRMIGVNITASGDNVGGLVGYNSGYISTSCSTGAVTGECGVGGLVGRNGREVTNCYSASVVSGDSLVGGLVGANWAYSRVSVAPGLVGRCYSSGLVRGTGDFVGGLVGQNWWEVTSSLWDIETSGQAMSDGGTGKTTDEMQTAKTFLSAGWDFVGETANGTEDIWKIAEGLDYPRLWWEPYDGRVTVVLGQVFTVTLESNPSTGYRWEWVGHQDSIVEQMGESQFKPRETGDPPLVGAGGWESFDFKAVHPGQMTLKLVYRRPWEEGVEPLKTFSLQVTVP